MYMHVMFPLFLENWKSIPYLLSGIIKTKCNPADLKFYLGKVINKMWGNVNFELVFFALCIVYCSKIMSDSKVILHNMGKFSITGIKFKICSYFFF